MFARRCVCVRNRPHPSAGGRLRPVWPCLWRVLQKGSLLAVSNVVCPHFAWQVALCDIPTCFTRRRKSFCVTGAIHFASFSDDELHVSWQVQHFGDHHRHFAWMSCCAMLRVFLRIAMSGLREVVTTCKFRGRPGIL